MKNEKIIIDRLIIVMMLLAILLGILSFIILPHYFLLLSMIIIIFAIRIDLLERHPFIISSLDITSPNSMDWKHELVYTYSIKWLKYVYFYELYINKQYPIIYRFNKYENHPKNIREKVLNEYYKKQN